MKSNSCQRSLHFSILVSDMTAFTLLHELREYIMENADSDPLVELIHIDGAYVSGRKRKPQLKVKSLVD